jgi:hypothetical protein
MLHTLRATPETCFWGFFDAALPPVLRVRSGDLVRIETLTHQAGDAPDLMMDAGVKAVYDAIPIATRGPGVHIMTGPIHVEGAQPGDTLEIRVLSMEPRLAYGTNIAAWWGHLYGDFGKERITIYQIDAAAGLARSPTWWCRSDRTSGSAASPRRKPVGSTAFLLVSSAATWTTGASGRARPCTTRSSSRAPSATWATRTWRRATESSPAPRSRPRPTRSCRSRYGRTCA